MATSDQPQPCQILTLPRELRDIIYEYIFSSTEVRIKPEYPTKPEEDEPPNHGLVLASKQIYGETIELYYKHSQFIEYSHITLCNWLASRTPRTRELLKHVKLYVMVPPPRHGPHWNWEEIMTTYIRQDFVSRLERAGIGKMKEKLEFETVRQDFRLDSIEGYKKGQDLIAKVVVPRQGRVVCEDFG